MNSAPGPGGGDGGTRNSDPGSSGDPPDNEGDDGGPDEADLAAEAAAVWVRAARWQW